MHEIGRDYLDAIIKDIKEFKAFDYNKQTNEVYQTYEGTELIEIVENAIELEEVCFENGSLVDPPLHVYFPFVHFLQKPFLTKFTIQNFDLSFQDFDLIFSIESLRELIFENYLFPGARMAYLFYVLSCSSDKKEETLRFIDQGSPQWDLYPWCDSDTKNKITNWIKDCKHKPKLKILKILKKKDKRKDLISNNEIRIITFLINQTIYTNPRLQTLILNYNFYINGNSISKSLPNNYTLLEANIFDSSDITFRNNLLQKTTKQICLSFILMWKFRKGDLKTTYLGQLLLMLDLNLIAYISKVSFLQLHQDKEHMKLMWNKVK